MIKKKGIIISFEGIDGSGKTTQIECLKQYLIRKGFSVEIIENTRISKKIMQILCDPELKEICPKTELLLHSALRAQDFQEYVSPVLNSGKIIIFNRFLDASFAYQGYGRGLDLKAIEWLNMFTVGRIKPDLTILLDLPPSEAFKRLEKSREKLDRIEKEELEFHNRVRKGYLEIAKKEPKRIKVIDATKSINEIQEEIKKIIEEYLNENKRRDVRTSLIKTLIESLKSLSLILRLRIYARR